MVSLGVEKVNMELLQMLVPLDFLAEEGEGVSVVVGVAELECLQSL